MALASWVIRFRRASNRDAAPENVNAISSPSRANTAPSTALMPCASPSGSLASRATPMRRPIS